MKKTALASLTGLLMLGTAPLHAATLDDVMTELKNLRHENTTIRKELAALRHREETHTTRAPAITVTHNTAQRAQAAHAEAVAPTTFRGGVSPRSVQAPLYPDEIYDWGGFYAGLNAGYAKGSTNNILTVIPGGSYLLSSANDGGFAGGQFGYNLQYDRVVLGIEADYQVASIGGQVNLDTLSNSSLKDFATIRGRIGYTFGRFLPFVTGGLAAGKIDYTNYLLLSPEVIHDSHVQKGWAAGGGFEYGLGGGWSGKLEYLHADLGKHDYLVDLGAIYGETFTVHPTIDLIRAGVNYHF